MPLTLKPPPASRDDSLSTRLAEVTSRWRRTVILRAGSQLVLVAIALFALLAYLDYRMHLPGLVRALALVSGLAAIPIVISRRIVSPLKGSGDPVQVALRIERAYPEFNDSLVSAVQFQAVPPRDRVSSPSLRRMAIRRASRKADRYDFSRAVDSRGTKRSVFCALSAIAIAVTVAMVHPSAASTAARRILVPFGGTKALAVTTIEITQPASFPHRTARGEPFELRLIIRGAIPDRATISVQLDNAASFDQSYAIERESLDATSSEMTLRIEPTRLPRDFQFRVRAGDGDTGWLAVQVLPPPVLVPLDGRPSPQLRLDFPAYTDLTSTELREGSGIIDCVAGTRVTLRAATDRPIARAWIAFRPDQPKLVLVPMLASIGAGDPLGMLGTDLLSREVWMEIPAAIDRDGTRLEIQFIPRLSGPYALRFEDATGLGGTRMFDVRVQPDPVPSINLERPAAGRDTLMLLPDAELTVRGTVLDKNYAVQSVWLEHRTNKGGDVRAQRWYRADETGRLLPWSAFLMRGAVPVPAFEPVRLRPQQLAFDQRLRVADFRHQDGTPLQPGDTLTLQLAADDFDDVHLLKGAGRSHEVELLIVSRTELEAVEQQAQSDVRAELLQLHAQQREARTQVQQALQQLRQTGNLRPEDRDAIAKAEQAQQRIRTKIDAPDEGIRALLEKQRQAVRDNRLPRSATTDRLDDAATELKRLAEEELEPLEADLAALRRLEPKQSPAPNLQRAEARQKEVETTLKGLLERLEPWSGAGEIRGEARSVLGELKRGIEKGETPNVPAGTPPEKLTPEQKAELERSAIAKDRTAERGRQLVEKMTRLATEKEAAAADKIDLATKKDAEAEAKRAEAGKQPPGSDEARRAQREADELASDAKQARGAAEELKREADALRKAAIAGNAEELKEQLRQSGQFTRQNQLNRANAEQQAAAGNLERMLNALEDQKAQDADRMSKKMADANKDLDRLFEDQERLQKKVEAANKLTNPEERKAELQKLAREQEKLEAEARDLAQRLTRTQAEASAQELRRATREMAAAREQLENGEAPIEKQDDVLDRIDDAQRELERDRQKNDEELQREQAAKSADDIKSLRDRQQRMIDEATRLHAIVKKDKRWDRPVRTSLNDMRQQQQALAEDARSILEKKFAQAAVFGRMLRQSADAMDLAAKRIDSRLDAADTGPFDLELEDIADRGIQSQQKLALKRLDQLLEAVKPDKPTAPPPAPPMGEKPPEMPMGGMKPMGDALPPMAQLKALRLLQADIAERTAEFDKLHPDITKLNDDEVAELELLEKMQADVAELVKQLFEAMGMVPGGMAP